MGIFDRIKDAIWGRAEAAPAPAPKTGTAPTGTAQSAPAGTAPTGGQQPRTGGASTQPTSAQTTSAPTSAPGSTPQSAPQSGSQSGAGGGDVDVGTILDKAVKDSGQKLNWKTSIVDLMKALDLDSSLQNRKELANELGYTGDTSDSATMNMWLHKQVIQKLRENGGKVPANLAD